MKTQKATHLIKHEILVEHGLCIVGKAYCGAEVMYPALKFTRVNVCQNCERIYNKLSCADKPSAERYRWPRNNGD